MNYWEDFFSLEKIIYPVLAAMVAGIIFFIAFYSLGLNFNEIAFYFFMAIGFISGNIIKTNSLQDKRKKENSEKKKKSKVL